jgi:hypothetical protein
MCVMSHGEGENFKVDLIHPNSVALDAKHISYLAICEIPETG